MANYRDHGEDGRRINGKFAETFETVLAELAREERYRGLECLRHPIERLHNGYFAQDKKGLLKDTRGDTQADDEVYNLIMKDKECLLSLDEPLRFIFSHSALREGWDNPNVFQICTLNESRSAVKKRQEIGRGLRLPVDQNGLRVFDESLNKLLVVANESYEDFARALQKEYEEDCGVAFGRVQALFKNEELINYLSALEVDKSVYEYVVYESDVERAFARKLDERPDIKLFVKLPGWFLVDTPLGKYNPDWAVVKHEDQTVYLVRETKSTRDFLKLRTGEADKIRCGQRHFEALGVSFAVAVSADEV